MGQRKQLAWELFRQLVERRLNGVPVPVTAEAIADALADRATAEALAKTAFTLADAFRAVAEDHGEGDSGRLLAKPFEAFMSLLGSSETVVEDDDEDVDL